MGHDVTVPLALEVDEIYNLACPASPFHYSQDPVQTTETSVLGAINMLSLAKNTGAKILQASAAEVYGDPVVYPQHESYWGNVNPLGPQSCYEEGKRCAESLCMNYRYQYGVNTKLVRLFNTIGPGMHAADGRVVSNFITQALLGQDITLFGDGSQTRSFCDVDDLIEGIVRTMNSEDDFMGPVNLGSTADVTILELVEMILQKTRSSSLVVHKPLPMNDPVQRNPDISLAREKLGWEPYTSLDASLDRVINYFRSQVNSRITNIAA